jgi:prepilin-type N-terminal cleavage/methylation domain-containing protein
MQTIWQSGLKIQSRKQGFTIIELLVVITIVALLITLLLPSLSKAREVATHVKCAAQLRQHGIAMTAYQSDNHGYYPSFGGPAVNDYSTWVRTQGSACGCFWIMNDNTGTESYFGDYLQGGNPGYRNLQSVDYCPAINWKTWGPYVFYLGYQFGSFQTALPEGWAGYNFYPGQKFYTGGNPFDFDTRPRREDPKEILATDLLFYWALPYYSSSYNGQVLTSSPAVPWFNPHNGNSNTTMRTGQFHQLEASGAVMQPNYSDTNLTACSDSLQTYLAAYAVLVTTNANSLENGYYYRGQ